MFTPSARPHNTGLYQQIRSATGEEDASLRQASIKYLKKQLGVQDSMSLL